MHKRWSYSTRFALRLAYRKPFRPPAAAHHYHYHYHSTSPPPRGRLGSALAARQRS
ncbi:hypothetical protein BV22DRAFT_1033624 [Leucogyrophana mollusca]|uniref:Uncharacterized protein n=1 Tax=Leucogyrophana mollusca TaxID=85980 RepID=A0ACB8BIX3_9AGAM|nr:hypothetical protein BV22DRAFT_1033624 [Leucogyrophana mollusca]